MTKNHLVAAIIVVLMSYAANLCAGSLAQKKEKSLLLQPLVGTTFHYAMKSTTRVGAFEGFMTMQVAMTISSADKSGTLTFDNQTSEGRYTQGKSVSEFPTTKSSSKIKPNGVVLEVQPESENALQSRVQRMMGIVVCEGSVEVGTDWKWNDPASPLNGQVAANGSGVVKAFGQKGGRACAQIAVTIREVGHESPMVSEIDAWICLKDGMLVQSTTQIKDFVPTKGTVGSMHITVTRLEK